MRFSTRTFLWSFVPFALLLLGSFWTIERMVVSTVRNGLRASLRDSQSSMQRLRSRSELQNSRFLRVVGENAALKAGLQLLLAHKSATARLTVEDQLREICLALGFDFLMVSSPEGVALAGVIREAGHIAPMDLAHLNPPTRGFFTTGKLAYQVTSVPVDQGEESIGILSVGEQFDFSEFTTPVVLSHYGKAVRSSLPGVSDVEVEKTLMRCQADAECEVRLGGETYLSLPIESVYFGDGYLLRSFQSVDRASGPVQAILWNGFVLAGLGALTAALMLSVLSSRSIVEPISRVVSQLRESEKTGVLPKFDRQPGTILEIRELTESFNHAGEAIQEAREKLHSAYVEFVGSLASVLDARDPYTAGHSRRVSEYACAIAREMNVGSRELEHIQIGALLHDVGKIGISDSVLQKAGSLTKEEFDLIKQHPTIGRRILEGVHGFQPYLPTVELHHENWDGTGYPWGLRRDAVPLGARIVHVVDAYDAMTTNRPYRHCMSHEEAISEIQENAGLQFDPEIVRVLLGLHWIGERGKATAGIEPAETGSIRKLAEAVGERQETSEPLVSRGEVT